MINSIKHYGNHSLTIGKTIRPQFQGIINSATTKVVKPSARSAFYHQLEKLFKATTVEDFLQAYRKTFGKIHFINLQRPGFLGNFGFLKVLAGDLTNVFSLPIFKKPVLAVDPALFEGYRPELLKKLLTHIETHHPQFHMGTKAQKAALKSLEGEILKGIQDSLKLNMSSESIREIYLPKIKEVFREYKLSECGFIQSEILFRKQLSQLRNEVLKDIPPHQAKAYEELLNIVEYYQKLPNRLHLKNVTLNY